MALLLVAAALEIGTKEVRYSECEPTSRFGLDCAHRREVAEYSTWQIRHWVFTSQDDDPATAQWTQASYTEQITPMREHQEPGDLGLDIWFVFIPVGWGLFIAAAVADLRGQDERFRRLTIWGFASTSAGLALLASGVAINAGLWSATKVEPFRPDWGILAVLSSWAASVLALRLGHGTPQQPLPELPEPPSNVM